MPTINTADMKSYSILQSVKFQHYLKITNRSKAKKLAWDDLQGEIRRIKTSLNVGMNGLNQTLSEVVGGRKILKARNDTHIFDLHSTIFFKSKC